MRSTRLRTALLPLLATLLLGACHGKNEPGGSSPQAALQGSIDLLKAGDFNGLWRHALPPADYATLRADWTRHQQEQPPVNAEDRAAFSRKLQQLTGPDADNKLYAELQPRLAAMQQQYADQLPVLISVGAAMAKSGIEQSKTLTDAQKSEATGVLDVLAPWARQSAWFDPNRARQAIGIAVATARKLDLKSPEQLRTMDFDTAMAEYSTGFAGVKQLLAVYGLSLDDTLQSVKLTPVSNSDGHAVVKIDYTLLGKPLSAESKLVERDGRWYSEDMLSAAREAHRQEGQSATAPASSVRLANATTAAGAAAKD
jgi:hypothetical protein